MTVPIRELVEVCERLTAQNRSLFEITGRWVTTEGDAAAQRWWSVTNHRHAWHADLWAARRPAVPIDAGDTAPFVAPADSDDTKHRVRWYLAELAKVAVDVRRLAERADADLDPGTARAARLVLADLDEIVRTAPPG